jgi:hypothetical protein
LRFFFAALVIFAWLLSFLPIADTPKARSRDWPPQIHVLGLPETERRAASQIQMQLHDLVAKGRDFAAALALFDYSFKQVILQHTPYPHDPDNKSWVHAWQYIAARDGAVTIYNFGKAFELISHNFVKCPTVVSLVDRESLKTARRRMRELFPRYEAIRHAIAHSAELMNQESSSKKHSISGPFELARGLVAPAGTTVMISGTLKDREFISTVKGQLQSYEISKATLDGLTDVRIDIYTAFLPVEAETLARLRNQGNPSNHTEPT